MERRTSNKKKSILRRLIFAGAALFVAAVIIFIASGFAKYIFDFDGYVRSLIPKNYALEDITLKAGETKTEGDFSLSLTDVKSENGKTTITFTLKGTESFSSGTIVRTTAIRSKADSYAAEIYLFDGENSYLMSCESSSVYRARATYVYSFSGEYPASSLTVVFKKLVVTEYSKK